MATPKIVDKPTGAKPPHFTPGYVEELSAALVGAEARAKLAEAQSKELARMVQRLEADKKAAWAVAGALSIHLAGLVMAGDQMHIVAPEIGRRVVQETLRIEIERTETANHASASE